MFHTTSDYTDFTAHEWNQEISLRHSARRISIRPPCRSGEQGQVRSSQPQIYHTKQLFVLQEDTNVAEQGYQLKHRDPLGKFTFEKPERYACFLSTSSGAGREPVAITYREVAGRGPDEPSPRPIWEGKTGSSSAFKPRRKNAHTHTTQSVMRRNHPQFGATPRQE